MILISIQKRGIFDYFFLFCRIMISKRQIFREKSAYGSRRVMESYIEKINNKILRKCSYEQAAKIKKLYLILGGCFLGLGILGFLGCFIAFFVLFFNFETENAMIFWFVAIPFILLIVTGSVITRIGDMLLTKQGLQSYEKALLKKAELKEAKRLKKVKHLNKKIAKLKTKMASNTNSKEKGGEK